MIDERKLSKRFSVRRLSEGDVGAIHELCRSNPLYYEYHPPMVTAASILEDMVVLPPNKTLSDKYFVGFWDGKALAAVMDLIDGYPRKEIAYIGFFMTDASTQGKGVGSGIISECASYLKECGFTGIRLAVDRGNPQSNHFWAKNRFTVDETYVGRLIAMERAL